VALRLALAHPGQGPAAWLGRPCQYTLSEQGQGCEQAFWTQRRYAPAVVAATGRALDQLRAETGARRLVLVGYSGGGALAILLAAARPDAVAPRLGRLPQLHLTGAADRITGSAVVRAFMARLPPGTPARLAEQPGFDHGCCWAAAWPRLAREMPGPGE
jgi:pimeloyl-ACP methyl ester carboxylesterase